ncbi:hypothetical protein SB783_45340, partial [Paraburkholderia sp. SIMBA_009]
MFTTAISLATRSTTFACIVEDAMHKLETFFYECVVDSQEANDGMTRASAEHVAKLLIGSAAAVPVMVRAGDMHSTVDQF